MTRLYSNVQLSIMDFKSSSFTQTYQTLRRFVALNVENARLTATEKLTLLFTAVAYFALLLMFGSLALVFVSIGVGHLLATTVAVHLAYLYVAAFYVIIVLLIVAFKRQLLLNPICRFISMLLAKNPQTPRKESVHNN